jgi:hypothetical protein
MAIHIANTHDFRRNGIKCLVYGPAGSGKTPLCATAPAPFIIDTDNGLLSLAQYNLPYCRATTQAQLNEVFDWIEKSSEARQFQTFCWDGISETADVMLNTAKLTFKDVRQAYQHMGEVCLGWCRRIRDMPQRNIVVTAKQSRIEDPDTGTTHFGPYMPGQAYAPQLPHFFDGIYQLTQVVANNQTYRVLRTLRDNNHEGRERSGLLNQFEESNLTTVFTKIHNS